MKLDYSDLLGKSFKYGGRGPNEYDCYGLTIELNKRLGRFMPSDYCSDSNALIIADNIKEAVKNEFIKIESPKSFCLVTFQIRPRVTSHIGMILDDLFRFIHITEASFVSVERLHPDWDRRITGYWEHQTWI